jgi:hypothetical protein
MKTHKDLKIGDTVWTYDENRRVYGPDNFTIWEKHWRPHTITGETSQSWIAGSGNTYYNGFKISKSKGTAKLPHAQKLLSYSLEEIALHKLRYRAWDIADRVKMADLETLAQIAALIGYDTTLGEVD